MSQEFGIGGAARRWRPAIRITTRSLTALVGGYACTAALVTLLARLLPVARVEATVWAMIVSFTVYAAIGLWCFRENALWRVVAAVWGIAALAVGAVWLLGVRP